MASTDQFPLAQVEDAIVDAYNKAELSHLVHIRLAENPEAVMKGTTLIEMADSLVGWAQRTGNLDLLIMTVVEDRPNNLKVKRLGADYAAWRQSKSNAYHNHLTPAPDPIATPSRAKKRNAMTSILLWVLGIGAIALLLWVFLGRGWSTPQPGPQTPVTQEPGLSTAPTEGVVDPDPQVVEQGRSYSVMPKHSGKCLGIRNDSVEASAPVVQFDCLDAKNQHWAFEDADDGYYRIKPDHSRLCLGVQYDSLENSARVVQFDCLEANNQLWRLEPAGDDYYRIVPKHSNKCMGVAFDSVENGAEVVQYDCLETDNQLFRLEPAS